MRRRNSAVLALTLSFVAVRIAPAGEPLPEPILSAEPQFAIPFSAESGDPTLVEIRLYASDDQGRTWRMHSRAKPPLDSFEFKAAKDGEYWFLVRTVDPAGRETPDGMMTPELRVVVDTAPPQLQLELERNPTGEAVAKWRIDDRRETADALKLSYRQGGQGPWLEIHPSHTKRQGDEHGAAGEMRWQPTARDGLLTVRAEVCDAAGNLATKEVTLAVPVTPITTAPVAVAASSPLQKPAATLSAPAPMIALRDPTRPLPVNSLSFELDYDVERADAQSIGKVEVWGTRDDGRTWVPLGVDEDKHSPCAVTVDQEGLYGFAILVTPVGGASGRRPRNGDEPEIRVVVDLRAPQVRLTTAEPDPEGRPSTMKINWQATDEHLGPQAVSLAYSALPQGPWLPLAVGIENTGTHICRFDSQSPEAVYLRIEVRDEAGNLGSFSTTAPMPIERQPVQVHIAAHESKEGRSPASKWFYVLR